MIDNLKEIKKISEGVDRIFYFVNPDNLALKETAMQRIGDEFSKDLGLSLYGKRCGQSVQNPKSLYLELTELGIEKVDIICVIKDEDGGTTSTLLSHYSKEKFIEELKTSDLNSGIIAYNIIKDSECSEYPIFEE